MQKALHPPAVSVSCLHSCVKSRSCKHRLTLRRWLPTRALAAQSSNSSNQFNLFLDCDGVLVDTEAQGHRVSFNNAFKQKGPQLLNHLLLVITATAVSSSITANFRTGLQLERRRVWTPAGNWGRQGAHDPLFYGKAPADGFPHGPVGSCEASTKHEVCLRRRITT